MNVLVINAGSSSLKYQLLNPETGDVLAKGLCERIGIDGKFTYKPQVEGKETLKAIDVAMPTHSEAIQAVLDALVDPQNGVVASMSEIDAVGHRVVHGGEAFNKSVLITEEVMKALEDGQSARSVELSEDERELFHDTPLITMKPVIYVANVSEDEANGDVSGNESFAKLKEFADGEHAAVMPICAQIEAEIAQLEGEDKEMFLSDMGIEEAGLDRLIRASYALLGLISYLTAGPKEVRAWTIVKGTKAPQAAGKIHSDFERGFIRAEVIAYDDLMRLGSMNAAKEAGLVRSEGKEYVMKDGDIVLFRFNV